MLQHRIRLLSRLSLGRISPLACLSSSSTLPIKRGDTVEFKFVTVVQDDDLIIEDHRSDTSVLDVGFDQEMNSVLQDQFIGKSPGDQFSFILTPKDREEEFDSSKIISAVVTQHMAEIFEFKESSYVELPKKIVDLLLKSPNMSQTQMLLWWYKFESELERGEMSYVTARVLEMQSLREGLFSVKLDFNGEFPDKNYVVYIKVVKNHGLVPIEFEEEEDE
jgi:hypothetical protein